MNEYDVIPASAFFSHCFFTEYETMEPQIQSSQSYRKKNGSQCRRREGDSGSLYGTCLNTMNGCKTQLCSKPLGLNLSLLSRSTRCSSHGIKTPIVISHSLFFSLFIWILLFYNHSIVPAFTPQTITTSTKEAEERESDLLSILFLITQALFKSSNLCYGSKKKRRERTHMS